MSWRCTMAKTKNVRLVRRDENITLTREQIDAVGDASHDLECVLRSIAALTVDIRAIATPCANEAGVDLPAAILALGSFGRKANNAMFVIVCDPVEAARLEASHG